MWDTPDGQLAAIVRQGSEVLYYMADGQMTAVRQSYKQPNEWRLKLNGRANMVSNSKYGRIMGRQSVLRMSAAGVTKKRGGDAHIKATLGVMKRSQMPCISRFKLR